MPATPSRYDQAGDAALGAAADVGIQVGGADRASGRICGPKSGAAVSIVVQQLTLAFGDAQLIENNKLIGIDFVFNRLLLQLQFISKINRFTSKQSEPH